jgi:hypothetical protein
MAVAISQTDVLVPKPLPSACRRRGGATLSAGWGGRPSYRRANLTTPASFGPCPVLYFSIFLPRPLRLREQRAREEESPAGCWLV